jgi:hypothetical protein
VDDSSRRTSEICSFEHDTWRRPDWRHAAAAHATAGGLAFLASDSTLAYGQFITHHINEVAGMTTYLLGQFGIIRSRQSDTCSGPMSASR